MRFEKRKGGSALPGGRTPPPPSPVHVHKFTGGKLVLGLTWRPLRHKDPSMRREEVKENAVMASATFGTIIESSSGRAMLGLLPASAPAGAAKEISGAGWLACSVDSRTWLLVPLADDLWWLAKVRPSEIEIKGDLVGTSEEIGKELDNSYADAQREGGDEPPRILVAGDTLPGSRVLEGNEQAYERTKLKIVLSDATLGRRARFARLRGIPPSYFVAVGAVVALAVVAFGGWAFYQHYQEQQALETARRDAALRAQQEAEIKSLREARMLKAVAEALASDTRTPLPSELAGRAASKLLVFNPDAAGWLFKPGTVTSSSVQTSWTYPRDSIGDNATFLAYAQAIGGVGSVSPTAQEASIMLPLPPLASRESMTLRSLPSVTAASSHFGTWLQRFRVAYPDAKVSLTAPTPKSVTYIDPTSDKSGGKATPVPPERTYQVGNFAVHGESMVSLASFTPDFPYVTVKNLTLQLKGTSHDYQWHIDGTYVVAP